MELKYLLPNHFLSKYEMKTSRGEIYWRYKHKKEFCKTYLNINIKDVDKNRLHDLMYSSRGGFMISENGLPIWEYTTSPVTLSL